MGRVGGRLPAKSRGAQSDEVARRHLGRPTTWLAIEIEEARRLGCGDYGQGRRHSRIRVLPHRELEVNPGHLGVIEGQPTAPVASDDLRPRAELLPSAGIGAGGHHQLAVVGLLRGQAGWRGNRRQGCWLDAGTHGGRRTQGQTVARQQAYVTDQRRPIEHVTARYSDQIHVRLLGGTRQLAG